MNYIFSHYWNGETRYVRSVYTSDGNLDVYWTVDKQHAKKVEYSSEEYFQLATIFSAERVKDKVKRFVISFDFSDTGKWYLINETSNNSANVDKATRFITREEAIKCLPNVYKTTMMPQKVNSISIEKIEVEL
jgi:hypothetical protein